MLTPSNMPPLGMKMPEFTLPTGGGAPVQLAQCYGARGLLVTFICNHCPYVQHIDPVLAPLGKRLQAEGVGMVAISSNDILEFPEDGPEAMVRHAAQMGYSFPYLYDAEQTAARAFDAACTPDFFLFDAQRRLYYRGRFDDSRPGKGSASGSDLLAAVAALVAGQPPLAEQYPSIGCNIKWKPAPETRMN